MSKQQRQANDRRAQEREDEPMIKSAAEARKITDPNGSFANDDPTRVRAEGGLEALNWPEVRALVEAAKDAEDYLADYPNDERNSEFDMMRKRLREAISDFTKAARG